MKHSVPHDLGQEMGIKVAKAAYDSYKERFAKYNPTANWVSDSKCDLGFTAKGISLAGTLEVYADRIDMELDVPFLLKPFKGKALSVIEEEIRKWIDKAKAGEVS